MRVCGGASAEAGRRSESGSWQVVAGGHLETVSTDAQWLTVAFNVQTRAAHHDC